MADTNVVIDEAGSPRSSEPDLRAPQDVPEVSLVEDEVLVEEISIDGMCGVY